MEKSLWKLPPRAKIYEALSAVADGRVKLVSERSAEVQSSDNTKSYLVEWSEDGAAFSSNDNASFYQGYIGYPIIAVLLVIGRLSYEAPIATLLSGIPWKVLNTKYKRNYDQAVDEALNALPGGLDSRQAIETEVSRIFLALQHLGLARGTARRQPPKAGRT